MSGEKDAGAAFFHQNADIFEQNLQAQLNKSGLFKDAKFLQDLQSRYASLKLGRGKHSLALDDKRQQSRILETDIIPDLLALDIALDQIRQTNQM